MHGGFFGFVFFCFGLICCLHNRASFYFCISSIKLIDLRVAISKTKAEFRQWFVNLRVLVV